jgi:hypothetical protein
MSSTLLSLGLDWGRGNFKITGPHGTAWLPSHVAHAGGISLRKADSGIRVAQPQYDVHFTTPGGTTNHFYVGHNAPVAGTAVEALDLSDYTGAPDQRALLYAAVSEYVKVFNLNPATSLNAKVSVGVPQKALMGEEAIQRKSAIRQWLATCHTWRAKGSGKAQDYRLAIEKVGVGSQAVGALYFYMTYPDRSYRTEVMDAILSQPLGILSLGSSTLELTAVQLRDNGRTRLPEILPHLEGSYPLGAYHMLNMSDSMQDWSLGYRDQQFRTAPKSREAAMATWLRRVQGHINQKWGNHHKDFAAVFVVGGMLKVPQVREWVRKQFRNAVLAGFDLGGDEDDCITAISQGLYRQIA